MSQFVDQVLIKVRSGDGGNGIVAWRREKYEPLGGPYGGSGGRGGHIFLRASADMFTLLDFRYKKEFNAAPGGKGKSSGKHGRNGEDLVIKVPMGTWVKDLETNTVIADLAAADETVLVAEGGRGGRGNRELASPLNRAPYFCEPGEAGISRQLDLTLKLIADIGIIGLPNAGKSLLLSTLTAANPKVASYPFSTLTPNLGVVKKPEGYGYVIADIPGLIKGSAQGAGLGHTFLRHVERTRLLIHLVDISEPEIEHNIQIINTELSSYAQSLEKLPLILVLNKIDLLGKAEVEKIREHITENLRKLMPNSGQIQAFLTISCITRQGIDMLKDHLFEILSQLPKAPVIHQAFSDPRARQHDNFDFIVIPKEGDTFLISGKRIERMMSVTNLKSPEALHHFYQTLKALGVIDALIKEGAQPGSTVMIGKQSFSLMI